MTWIWTYRLDLTDAEWSEPTFQPRSQPDPDPPRCWSCGHPFGAGCECTCCYDDHSEEPGPHE